MYGIPISLRARNKLGTYSSFEKWEIAEQRTLKQVENTRKGRLYLSKYHQTHFSIVLSEMIFLQQFPEKYCKNT